MKRLSAQEKERRPVTMLARTETPEERELAKKTALTALEGQLAERELDLATLEAEIRAFEARYLRTGWLRGLLIPSRKPVR